MQRNIELIKQILLEIENQQTYDQPLDIKVDGFDFYTINYHIKLLFEAKLIHIFGDEPTSYKGSVDKYFPVCLTWEGHEFLATTKNKTIWNKTVKFIEDKGLGMSFDILKGILLQEGLKITGLK
ncbi:DUF2513 domain-containing protein [Cyanobacterium aponinum]|uniref:DUF2513 domain-containing protein n=1 Tax=Cyanobacterium aponinum TaxID=379064 RepID=UPI000C12B2F5|nr:DUF2513 domain-containing protein [Cyanobacterium aponinum]PHV63762.1 hypothetical protein CSQ80_04110 [Cyanobacterium aponinum IPPAS B-1201]